VWNTPTGRANFLVFEGVAEDSPVNGASVLRLATLRSHNQYNTTIYGLDDRYRGVFGGRMVVFMNEVDMKERGIAPDALVEIESLVGDGRKRVVRGFKVRPYAIPQGSIGAYYPETNPLLPLAHHDLKSKTPAAKSIPVLVRPQ
jgi:anaerobic selenocysteine-containing dehydrogenase